MEELPAEIWNQILGNLHAYKDCENASKAFPGWTEILCLTKSSWLFGRIFPLLLEHLSNKDIYTCRLVCNRWCHGIDNFCENNIHTRPILKDSSSESKMKYLNYDDPLDPLVMVLYRNGLLYNAIDDSTNRQDLLMTRYTTCRSPFPGGSVRFFQIGNDFFSPKHFEILHKFGHHIKTLTLDFNFASSEPCTSWKLAELMELVPNLRKLEIEGNLQSSLSYFNNEQLKEWSSQYPKSQKPELLMPKLESLVMDLSSDPAPLTTKLLELFCNSKLQTLKLRGMSVPTTCDFAYLTNLNIEINSETDLNFILNIRCMLQHLNLVLKSQMSALSLFKSIQHFSKSLVSFGFICYPEDSGFRCGMKQEHQRHLFMNPKILGELSKVRSVSLEGWVPPSLNFLCGLSKSLEYLYIDLPRFRSKRILDTETPMEMLDLLDLYDNFPNSNKLLTYKSNVWKVLPKLKVMSMNIYRPFVKGEFRRDIYDKFQY